MAKGGKRPGSGRPKGVKDPQTYVKEQARAILINMVQQHIEPIVNAMIDKALTGDIPAARELLDRAWGKPKQELEMTGKDGKDLFEPSDKIKELAAALNELNRTN